CIERAKIRRHVQVHVLSKLIGGKWKRNHAGCFWPGGERHRLFGLSVEVRCRFVGRPQPRDHDLRASHDVTELGGYCLTRICTTTSRIALSTASGSIARCFLQLFVKSKKLKNYPLSSQSGRNMRCAWALG